MSYNESPSTKVNQNYSKLKIIAAIPAYNEGQFISQVVSETKQFVDDVVVIDDGSNDDTTEKANKGYGESIKSCFNAAKSNYADILVTLDGDSQHDPHDIPQVLDPILKGEADLVIGSRFLKQTLLTRSIQQINIPRYRKFGIDVITFLYNFGSKVKVSDAQSGFRAYNENILNAFSPTEKGMATPTMNIK